jgi:hypothetical protein
MSDAFTRAWLRRDTYVDGLTPAQRRAVRALCEQFYRDGQRNPNMPKPCTIVPNSGTTQGATQ